MNSTTITISECRLSYISVFQPKPPFNNPTGEPKYSVTVLVPKSNLQAKAAIDSAIEGAIQQGITKCWNGVRPPQPAVSIHDGDSIRPSDGEAYGPECKGMWVFTASCKADRPPFLVDSNIQPIIQQGEIYSGVWGNVNISFFPYNTSGKKGIGVGLNGIQKTRDDEPLGNVVTAQDAFSAVAPTAQPQYTAPAQAYYPPQQQYAAQPTYPQYQTPPAQGYSQQAMPSGYQIDPITGQPIPSGMPIMGM